MCHMYIYKQENLFVIESSHTLVWNCWLKSVLVYKIEIELEADITAFGLFAFVLLPFCVKGTATDLFHSFNHTNMWNKWGHNLVLHAEDLY